MRGWAGSPPSKRSATSRPTWAESSGTAVRAASGPASFPGKSTCGIPMTSSSRSVPITTPWMRERARVFFLFMSVLLNLLSLERHVLAGLGLEGAGSLEGQVLPLDLDGAVLLHRDGGIAALDDDRLLALDGDLLRHDD